MMKRNCLLAGIALFLITGCATMGAVSTELNAFPPAAEGMTRFVIVLPEPMRGDEAALMVELIPGKTMLTDGVNLLRLGSTIEAKPLRGWGYTYYEVSGSSQVMSTMMAPPEGAQQVEAFVSGVPLKVRYNSRLPLVVYAPDGFEVRYRIWKTSGTARQARKG